MAESDEEELGEIGDVLMGNLDENSLHIRSQILDDIFTGWLDWSFVNLVVILFASYHFSFSSAFFVKERVPKRGSHGLRIRTICLFYRIRNFCCT